MPLLPIGWTPSRSTDVQQLYSLIVGRDSVRPGLRRFNILYANAARIARSTSMDEVLASFESDVRLFVGERAHRRVFVHAGVVGWRGRAIVIPGESFSGKTTLVRALCDRGATYYSDEFAAFDARGRVYPFPTPLGVRCDGMTESEKRPPQSLGISIGSRPIPVGLVAVTHFRNGLRWRPRRLTAGASVLAMLANTVPARRQPTVAMATLRQVATSALVLKGGRGEAGEMAGALLRSLERSGAPRGRRPSAATNT